MTNEGSSCSCVSFAHGSSWKSTIRRSKYLTSCSGHACREKLFATLFRSCLYKNQSTFNPFIYHSILQHETRKSVVYKKRNCISMLKFMTLGLRPSILQRSRFAVFFLSISVLIARISSIFLADLSLLIPCFKWYMIIIIFHIFFFFKFMKKNWTIFKKYFLRNDFFYFYAMKISNGGLMLRKM